jgi:hypothetical protein
MSKRHGSAKSSGIASSCGDALFLPRTLTFGNPAPAGAHRGHIYQRFHECNLRGATRQTALDHGPYLGPKALAALAREPSRCDRAISASADISMRETTG